MPKVRKPPDPFVQAATARLIPLGEIRARPMFGVQGIYADGLLFALIAGGALYFKVDDRNLPLYRARGIELFRPLDNRPDLVIRYCRVPQDVFDGPELVEWAEASVEAARRGREPPKRRGKA